MSMRGEIRRLWACAVGVLIATAVEGQTTYYVDGSCGNDLWSGSARMCQPPNGPKRTIQSAVDASTSGDTIVVADGVYTLPVSVDSKGIRIESENGPSACRIQDFVRVVTASANPPVFSIAGIDLAGTVNVVRMQGEFVNCVFSERTNERLRIEGAVVRVVGCTFPKYTGSLKCVVAEGWSFVPSSIEFVDCVFQDLRPNRTGDSPVECLNITSRFLNCVFERCVGMGLGGAVNVIDGSAIFERCRFTGNRSRFGGGAVSLFNTDAVFNDCVFEDNTTERVGGAVRAQRTGPTTFRNCTFARNLAVDGPSGAGGAISGGDDNLLIDGCVFDACRSRREGGAVRWRGDARIDVRATLFQANEAGATGLPDMSGGAADLASGTADVAVADSRFVANMATGPGGALRIAGAAAAVSGCTFEGNSASDGGAMSSSANLNTIATCVFRANTAEGRETSGGGGVWAAAPTAIVNCLFDSNTTRAPVGSPDQTLGGAVFAGVGMNATACTFSGNRSASGSAISTVTPATLDNCVLWDNSGTLFDGPVDVSFSDVEGGWPGVGVIDRDPRFGDPASGDYRLGHLSPCVDAGDNSTIGPGGDLLGNPRRVDDPGMPDSGLGTPPIVDMGAFERQEASCYPDCDQSTGVGLLDLFDFLCFQNSFVNGEPYACECDTTTGPNVCDIFDFLCFQSAFVAGCP